MVVVCGREGHYQVLARLQDLGRDWDNEGMKKSEDTEIAEVRWSGLSVEKLQHLGSPVCL